MSSVYFLEDPLYHQPVNRDNSTVHVPIDIYDKGSTHCPAVYETFSSLDVRIRIQRRLPCYLLRRPQEQARIQFVDFIARLKQHNQNCECSCAAQRHYIATVQFHEFNFCCFRHSIKSMLLVCNTYFIASAVNNYVCYLTAD